MGLDRIISAAMSTVARVMGTSVVVRRGAESIQVQAVPGSTEHDQLDGQGSLTRFTSRDFIIPRDQYVFAGRHAEPERGDRFEEQVDNDLVTYEVLPDSAGPAWTWHGPAHTHYRIHAKRIGLRT